MGILSKVEICKKLKNIALRAHHIDLNIYDIHGLTEQLIACHTNITAQLSMCIWVTKGTLFAYEDIDDPRLDLKIK